MLNHLHLIVGSPDIAGFLRDFKQYTSRKLIENIKETEPLVLDLFRDEKMHERFGRGYFPRPGTIEKKFPAELGRNDEVDGSLSTSSCRSGIAGGWTSF